MTEFEEGDVITVEVYVGLIKCRVKEIKWGVGALEPLYHAENINGELPLVTAASGRSIVESRYYVAITEEERARPFA